jgi:hypothetical protein
MPDEGLRLLAGTVAGALVKAMDTYRWQGVRGQVVQVLGRDAPRRADLVTRRLEESRDELSLVPIERRIQARAEITTELRGSIHAMLWDAPELAEDLRAVLESISPPLPKPPVDVNPMPHIGPRQFR